MQTKTLITLLAGCIIFLTSCFDTEEKIVINKDNSGTYSLTMDMSKLLKMMSQMGKSKDGEKKEMQKKDSVIYFKSFVDTSTQLTAEEKEMIKDGSLHVKINEQTNELKFVINLPFKKIQDLAYLRENYLKALDKINLKDQLNDKKKKEGDENKQQKMPGDMSSNSKSLIPAQDSYKFTAAPGKISNKFISKESFDKEITNDSTMQMLKGMSEVMGLITYKTVFILPRPVKHYTQGNNTVVSADKKTVTFKSDLNTLLKKPESLEYELEY